MAEQTYERKVLKGFTCRVTKKPYPKGSVFISTDTERINELVKKGNISGDDVKTLKEAQEEAEKKSKEKYEGTQDEIDKDNLEKADFEVLKKGAKEKGLQVEGTGKNGAIKKEDYIKALKG